jgi:hypothetical protein
MLCQKLKRCSPNICSQRRWVYNFYHVHFPRCLFGFVLLCFLSLFSCSLLVHFSFIVWVLNFFCNNLLVSHSFHVLLGLHCLVIYCCLLVFYLFISLLVVWISKFFNSLNIVFATMHLFLELDTIL